MFINVHLLIKNYHLIIVLKISNLPMIEMMSGNKRGRPAAGLQTCQCGYATTHTSNFKKHKSTCVMVKETLEVVPLLQKQIKDLQDQLAAKDQVIKDMAKIPRTVNNITVDSTVNVFGKESIKHINPKQIQALLADPVNAVPQFIKLKHRRAPDGVNNNIRVPNKKRAIYQVVVGEGEEKEWENKTKGEVLEQLYDENSGHLEAEADEETRVGSQFLNYQDKVKESAGGEDGGRRYKEQLDKIHCVLCT